MISMDLRQRIVDAYDRGEGSIPQIARRFAVGHATVERLLQRRRLTGSIAPAPAAGGPQPIVQDTDFGLIEAWLAEPGDLTQQDLAERFEHETGRSVSRRTISRVLERMRQTRKKSR